MVQHRFAAGWAADYVDAMDLAIVEINNPFGLL
jgi:hypothetical protein